MENSGVACSRRSSLEVKSSSLSSSVSASPRLRPKKGDGDGDGLNIPWGGEFGGEERLLLPKNMSE